MAKFIPEMQENESYVDIANKLAKRDDVVIDGLNLDNKLEARAFILAFAHRHGMPYVEQ